MKELRSFKIPVIDENEQVSFTFSQPQGEGVYCGAACPGMVWVFQRIYMTLAQHVTGLKTVSKGNEADRLRVVIFCILLTRPPSHGTGEAKMPLSASASITV